MQDLVPLDDEALVARVLEGRREAFQVLYERYLKRIYGLVQRMVGRQDAEEVTQESFLQAFRTLGRFRGESRFYTWMYRVAANTSLQHLRRRGRREARNSSYDELAEHSSGNLGEPMGTPLPDPERMAADREFQRHVKELVEELPDNQRLVILLGPVQGLSYEEMARVLETSVAVVKARLHRARENLRTRMAARYPGERIPGTEASPKAADPAHPSRGNGSVGEGVAGSPRAPPGDSVSEPPLGRGTP